MAWADAQSVAEPGFVQAHLGRCASCRSELADLHAFQARLKPPVRPRAPFRWIALAAAIIILALLVGRKPSVPGPLPVASAPPAPAVSALQVVERAPILDELYRPEGKLLGKTPQAALRALSPVGIVTASDRPVFRWEEVPGAAAYVVSVYDGNFKKVAESSKLSTNMWQPQEPLTRGMRLSWQVSARVGDRDELLPAPPAREAVFQVMNSESFAQIEHARGVEHASPVQLGLLYARAGALEDAETEFRKAPEAKELSAKRATAFAETEVGRLKSLPYHHESRPIERMPILWVLHQSLNGLLQRLRFGR